MLTPHGSPIIAGGALLAALAGGGVFAIWESYLLAIIAAAGILAATAVVANRRASGQYGTSSPPSPPVRAAVGYITVGALTEVRSRVWYLYLRSHPPARGVLWYYCYGLLLTGLVLLGIGLAAGRIGLSPRRAETTTRGTAGAEGREANRGR